MLLSRPITVTHPHIAEMFLPELNNGERPGRYSHGSTRIVTWKCPRSSLHIWQDSIHDKCKKIALCPFCNHDRVCPDNCLSATHPEVANQFHPCANGTKSPGEFTASSITPIVWLCPKGILCEHSWIMPINQRIRHPNCPFCTNRKLCLDNCLHTKFPTIALDWDYDKNGTLTPFKVQAGAKRKVYWQCSRCSHRWAAEVRSRTSKTKGKSNGCPQCYRQCSKQELFFYSQLLYIFPNALNDYKIDRFRYDITDLTHRISVEIDGYPWHSKTTEKDIRKAQVAEKQGLKIFRIRDQRLPKINESDVLTDLATTRAKPLLGAFKQLLIQIHRYLMETDRPIADRILEYLRLTIPPNLDIYRRLRHGLLICKPQDNIADKHPYIANQWHPTKNGRLLPENVTAGSAKAVWWRCQDCGSEWSSAVKDRFRKVGRRKPCPSCHPRKRS